MSKFIVRSGEPDETGCVLRVTPESAGWNYVGFEVYRLSAGQSFKRGTGNQEVLAVVLSGIASIFTKRSSFENIGRRMSVFEPIPPYSVYVPAEDHIRVEARTDLEIALCAAPADGRLEARLIAPEQVGVERRGSGNMERIVRNILPEQEPAERLLVVEVFTPSGHWSSYPPHKHDVNNLPDESQLEETYYHKLSPEQGFAVQRIYSDDLALDETLAVRSGDAVLVPRGYHPVSAPPGYDSYYLNVMAGPVRTWKFHNDPDHAWLASQGMKGVEHANPIRFAEGRTLDFIGLGRACIDLNANEIHRPLEETATFTKYVGGSPANITIALAKLGMKTGFIGRVSDDAHGRFIVQYLQKSNIDTDFVVTDRSGSVTGLTFTEIKSPTDCSILMYRDNAADLKLEPADVSEDYIRNSKALLISGTALAQSPSREAAFKAMDFAAKHGVVIFFDIDYRPYTWKSAEETGLYCRLAAEKSDCVIGGREEFDLIEALDGPLLQQDEATAKRWFNHRAKIVVVKRGGEGNTVFSAAGERFEGFVFPAKVVKTFGAGDSFAGAFIYGLMQGWSLDRCQRFGSASASIVVSSHSCSDAMPTVRQIEDRIDLYMKEKR